MDTPNTYWDLFWGYTALWAIVILLILKLGAEQRRIASELKNLDPR